MAEARNDAYSTAFIRKKNIKNRGSSKRCLLNGVHTEKNGIYLNSSKVVLKYYKM